MVEVVRTCVVRHIQVGPTIVVVVAPDSLHAEVVRGVVHASCFRNVLEGAVAAIVEQEIRLARKAPRSTLHHDPAETPKFIIAPKFWQLVDVNEYVSRHKQIYVPISIKVAPGGACAESANPQTSFFGYVFKPAVAQITIESVAAVPRHIDIVPTVIVEISHGNAHPPSLARQAGFFGDVFEF